MTYVFFERIWTRRRTDGARHRGDAAFLVSLEQTHSQAERAALRAQASRMLDYPVTFQSGAAVAPPEAHHRPSSIDRALDEIIAQQVQGARAFEATSDASTITIRIALKDGVLQMAVPRSRVTVTSPDVFILWMAGSALALMAIAVLFLRNQVRPIERLALAADAFGKGRTVPDTTPMAPPRYNGGARIPCHAPCIERGNNAPRCWPAPDPKTPPSRTGSSR